MFGSTTCARAAPTRGQGRSGGGDGGASRARQGSLGGASGVGTRLPPYPRLCRSSPRSNRLGARTIADRPESHWGAPQWRARKRPRTEKRPETRKVRPFCWHRPLPPKHRWTDHIRLRVRTVVAPPGRLVVSIILALRRETVASGAGLGYAGDSRSLESEARCTPRSSFGESFPCCWSAWSWRPWRRSRSPIARRISRCCPRTSRTRTSSSS
jgi:hypothetical protein